jgi:hypothetical protein
MSNYIPYKDIASQEDIDRTRREMLKRGGNYPPDISDCYVVGINGDCGETCPVLKRGECKNEREILSDMYMVR